MRNVVIAVTCEHAGNKVPAEYAEIFQNHQTLLNTHRGWDIGAYHLAQKLSGNLGVPLHAHLPTRLLIDINRSLYRRTLFSEITKPLCKNEKLKILNHYYYPYRNKVEQYIDQLMQMGNFVLHISVHSFTPVLNNSERRADIGILYNPERLNEKGFAKIWKSEMNKINPDLRIRFNYPYRGKPDGFPAFFRRKYNDNDYAGYEFEINQKWYEGYNPNWEQFSETIITGLKIAHGKFSFKTEN